MSCKLIRLSLNFQPSQSLRLKIFHEIDYAIESICYFLKYDIMANILTMKMIIH